MAKYTLPTATENILGGVKIGNGIDVTQDGVISIHDYDNMKENISALSESVEQGKSLVATSITTKGVNTSSTDSFKKMSDNILAIPSASPFTDCIKPYTNTGQYNIDEHDLSYTTTFYDKSIGEQCEQVKKFFNQCIKPVIESFDNVTYFQEGQYTNRTWVRPYHYKIIYKVTNFSRLFLVFDFALNENSPASWNLYVNLASNFDGAEYGAGGIFEKFEMSQSGKNKYPYSFTLSGKFGTISKENNLITIFAGVPENGKFNKSLNLSKDFNNKGIGMLLFMDVSDPDSYTGLTAVYDGDSTETNLTTMNHYIYYREEDNNSVCFPIILVTNSSEDKCNFVAQVKDIVCINCYDISPNINSVGKLFSIENEAYVQLNGQYFLKMGEE